MKETQEKDLNSQQSSSSIIKNGKVPQSCVKTTKQVGTSTPKPIKRRLTFNILDTQRKSSALDEISEENTRDIISKVI